MLKVLVSEDYVSCVGIELPPGMWRKAIKSHPKTKCILMRYSTIYDKQDIKNKNIDDEDGGNLNYLLLCFFFIILMTIFVNVL